MNFKKKIVWLFEPNSRIFYIIFLMPETILLFFGTKDSSGSRVIRSILWLLFSFDKIA